MQAIVLRPQRRQVNAMMIGMAALSAAMALAPLLCLPLGLLLPLFACPLAGTGRRWAAVAVCFVPPVISLLSGAAALYSLSLLFVCGAPVAATLLLPAQQGAGDKAIVCNVAAYVFALSLVLLSLRGLMGGDPTRDLAQWITDQVARSSNAASVLYRLAASGLISVPKAYRNEGLLAHMLDPALLRQMLMSLRLTLRLTAEQLLPTLVVQCCLLGGVFSALRAQRMNHSYLLVDGQHREKVKMAVIPGFSALSIPQRGNGLLLGMAVAALLCGMADGAWFQTLSQLLFATFEGVFQLAGGAVFVGMMAQKHPDRKPLYGGLAAALYVLAPVALLLLGIMDSMLHFRSNQLFHKKEEDEE